MLNLSSSVNVDFATFLDWWLRELGQWVPEPVKRLVNDKQGHILVTPDGGHLRLTYVHAGEHRPLSRLERNGAAAPAYQQLLEQDHKLGKAAVVLRLPAAMALARELVLPKAAKENLAQVIAYELDRYTPFKADQVYFSAQAKEDLPELGQFKVLLVLTRRELLDTLYEDVKAIGMRPVFADCEAAPNDLGHSRGRYNLLPEKYRQKIARTPFLIQSGLLGLLALLAVGVLVLPVLFQYQTVAALGEQVRAIEKDAKKIKAMQAKINDAMGETQQLLDEKTSMPMMVAVLDALSTLMKDDTSLTYLQFSDGRLQIQGESPSASTLIGVLEDSELFNNARFVSPVTQDNVSKLERFQITVDITKRGADDANKTH